MKRLVFVMTLTALAGTALAHSGVTNPDVMTRMHGMKSLGQNVGVLGDMAKGKTVFDETKAREALEALAQQTDLLTTQFKPNSTDPKTEALPNIWTDWSGFIEQANALKLAVAQSDVGSLDTLKSSLGNIGKTCRSCHEGYRIKK